MYTYAILGAFVLTLVVITALAVIHSRNLFAAIMLSGIYSLLMAVSFTLLDAIDVALTEAAVGAGVSTVLSLGALALITDREKSRPDRRLGLAMVTLITASSAMIFVITDAPVVGDPNAPVQQHLRDFYFDKTEHLIHIPNVVTALLGAYRGYDTFGETTVVLTAALGVLLLLGRPQREASTEPNPVDRSLRQHSIPQVVGRLLIPFIVLYALYVQFHGEISPGGGFQAGTLVAASVILFGLLEGNQAALRALPMPVLAWMMSTGILIYGGVGVTCMFLGGRFLDYSVLLHEPGHGQHLGLTLIEFGVGVTVTGVLITIFHCFAARKT